ncbi:unnamed protein product [Closterium sp. Yama58-4]|nr:unnamed protein product [Closterium sp. Yama58-4]
MALCVSSQPSSSDHRARPSLTSPSDMMRSSTSPAAFARHHRYPAHQPSPAGSPPSQTSSPGGSTLGTPSRFYQASPPPPTGEASETLLPQEQQARTSLDGPSFAPTFLQMQPRRPTWLPADQQDELLDDEALAEPPVRGTARAIARGASWTGSASSHAVFGGRRSSATGDGVLGGEPLSSESVCPIPAVNWKESAMSDEARRAVASSVCPIAPQDWRALSRTSSASASEHDLAASSVLSTAVGLSGSCGASTPPGSLSSAGSSPLHRSPLNSGPLQSTSSCPLPADVFHGVVAGGVGSASAGSGFSAIGATTAYASTGTTGKESGAVASGVSGVVPTAVPLHVSLREQLLRANSGSCAYQGPAAVRPAISRMAMSCSNSRQSSGNFAGYSQSSNSSPARDSIHGSEDTGSNGGVNWQELDNLCQSMDAAGIMIEQIDLTPLDDASDDIHGHASAAAASFSGSGRNAKVSAAPEAGEGAAPVKYAVKFGGMSMWHSPSH